MGEGFHQVRAEYLKLRIDIEPLRKLLESMPSTTYQQLLQALAPIQQRYTQIARLLENAGVARSASALAQVIQANQHWQGAMCQALSSTRFLEDAERVHGTWLASIKNVEINIAQLQAAAGTSLTDAIYRLTVAEKFFSRIDLEALGQSLAIATETLSRLSSSIDAMASTYAILAGSPRTPQALMGLPEFVLPETTREVFTQGYGLDMIAGMSEREEESDTALGQLIAEVERQVSGCNDLLRTIDPDLVVPYAGAHEALSSSNPDKGRHVLASLRELWSHLLRRVAPDHEVLAWVSPGKDDLLDNKGRPTRKARILYVCRKIGHGPLSDFTVADTRAFVKLLDLFQRVHELRGELTDQQLRALVIRSDSWLTYILRIWEETR